MLRVCVAEKIELSNVRVVGNMLLDWVRKNFSEEITPALKPKCQRGASIFRFAGRAFLKKEII